MIYSQWGQRRRETPEDGLQQSWGWDGDDWIWKRGGSSEGLQLDYLLPWTLWLAGCQEINFLSEFTVFLFHFFFAYVERLFILCFDGTPVLWKMGFFIFICLLCLFEALFLLFVFSYSDFLVFIFSYIIYYINYIIFPQTRLLHFLRKDRKGVNLDKWWSGRDIGRGRGRLWNNNQDILHEKTIFDIRKQTNKHIKKQIGPQVLCD